jgi:hypothetical protein
MVLLIWVEWVINPDKNRDGIVTNLDDNRNELNPNPDSYREKYMNTLPQPTGWGFLLTKNIDF